MYTTFYSFFNWFKAIIVPTVWTLYELIVIYCLVLQSLMLTISTFFLYHLFWKDDGRTFGTGLLVAVWLDYIFPPIVVLKNKAVVLLGYHVFTFLNLSVGYAFIWVLLGVSLTIQLLMISYVSYYRILLEERVGINLLKKYGIANSPVNPEAAYTKFKIIGPQVAAGVLIIFGMRAQEHKHACEVRDHSIAHGQQVVAAENANLAKNGFSPLSAVDAHKMTIECAMDVTKVYNSARNTSSNTIPEMIMNNLPRNVRPPKDDFGSDY